MTIGFPSIQAAGLLFMIQQLINTKYSIIIIITPIMWSINCLISIFLFKKSHTVQTQIQFKQFMKQRFDDIL